MARRPFPPRSRIFNRRRPVWPRLLSAPLLPLALGVTAFGIATAVYLDRPPAPAPSPATEQSAAPAPVSIATVHDPVAAAAAVPQAAEQHPAAAALARLEPEAGKPAELAAPPPAGLTPPPAAPASAAPAAAAAPPRMTLSPTRYWVEYGVFAGAGYAGRLKQALAARGLESVVVRTHDRRGHVLLRVRSAPLSGLAAARQAAHQAEAAFRIATLIHRGAPERAEPGTRYWVQFGAFRTAARAARLQRRLRRTGVETTVSSVRGTSGKPLYLVRSSSLATHAAAVALAQRGRPIAEVVGLVGETPGHVRVSHAGRAPPRHLASSG